MSIVLQIKLFTWNSLKFRSVNEILVRSKLLTLEKQLCTYFYIEFEPVSTRFETKLIKKQCSQMNTKKNTDIYRFICISTIVPGHLWLEFNMATG